MAFPADWYPDPAGDPSLLRWWDGNQWTEHTHPIQQAQQQPQQVEQQWDAGAQQTQAGVAAAAEEAVEAADRAAPIVVEQLDDELTIAQAPDAAGSGVATNYVGAAADPAVAPVATGVGGGVDAVAGIRSDLLSGDYAEKDVNTRVVLQNSKMLKVRLGEPVLARQGSMVAFQGQVDFDHEGAGGVGKFLKKSVTGEGVQLMRCTGQGEVFFASEADQVHILHLEGSALSVNGRNVLAFEPTLAYDIQRVQGAGVLTGGLFNTRLSGHGWVAITTKGQPVVLHTNQPTFGDPQAVVAWSANLQTSLNKTVKAKALVGLGSGEAFQLAFQGEGIVIVQPAEYAAPSAGA
ncbi:MAG: AIM24 family protein [Ilumatobacter sp.]|uniref:AIM24 family protein n=1 Tax=Ilumatobacter sp. TaxID=1967498 RepID=UPI003C73ADEC